MAEQYTYNKVESNELIKEGDYEARIERIEKKTLATSGREKLSLMFRIRDDVEQPYRKMVVFEDIWSEKDNPQYFNRKRLNQLLGTQDIEEGRVFADIDAVIEFLKNSNLIIHVSVEFDDYNNKEVNKVKFYASSKAKGQTLIGVDTTAKIVQDIDDLPF